MPLPAVIGLGARALGKKVLSTATDKAVEELTERAADALGDAIFGEDDQGNPGPNLSQVGQGQSALAQQVADLAGQVNGQAGLLQTILSNALAAKNNALEAASMVEENPQGEFALRYQGENAAALLAQDVIDGLVTVISQQGTKYLLEVVGWSGSPKVLVDVADPVAGIASELAALKATVEHLHAYFDAEGPGSLAGWYLRSGGLDDFDQDVAGGLVTSGDTPFALLSVPRGDHAHKHVVLNPHFFVHQGSAGHEWTWFSLILDLLNQMNIYPR
jgi:hypothetical protein